MNNLLSKLEKTKKFLSKNIKKSPKIGIILGSGLGSLADSINVEAQFPYKKIPNFPQTTVEGHPGRLIFAKIHEKSIIIMQGRLHFYEGHSMQDIIFPVRLMKFLGTEYLILTSATGGINPKYRQGDIIILKDHINLMGDNPLRGIHQRIFGERFPDMGNVYDGTLRKLALKIAKKQKIRAHEGTYVAVRGPSYETPAEIEAFKKLGADIVGMSMVPEAITASQMGIKVLGLCYVSNKANSHSKQAKQVILHKHVIRAGRSAGPSIAKLIKEFIKNL